ncbi:MAG: hypothetical protein AAFX85_12095 [Pseudomonadota bacterium]
MKRLWVRRLAISVFSLNILAVTWPVLPLFRTAEPLIFGLPLSMAWPIGWILIVWVTLLVLDRVESRGDGE